MGSATLEVTERSYVSERARESRSEESLTSEDSKSELASDESIPEEVASDTLLDLGDEIATLAAHLHAATYRLLTLIAEFDRLQGWEPGGHRSCAHWLAFRIGIDLGAAREKVRAARVLAGLPQTSAAMEQGELSFAKVRALTRVATPESEEALLELARCSTAAQLERTVRAWRRMCRLDENELERIRHRSRCFSVFPDEEGMYLVRGRLDPEVGAMLMRALEAASDALFRASTSEEIEPKQRRADAVGLLAERALAVGFGCVERSASANGDRVENATGESTRDGTAAQTNDATRHDTNTRSTGTDFAPLSGTRAERYQVVLHVEASTLEKESEPGRSELEDGTRVSAETSRRLSCDASLVRLTKGPSGEVRNAEANGAQVEGNSMPDPATYDGSMRDGGPRHHSTLDIGRKTRTIPPALRRAQEARDRGCRFPGCGLRFTDAHHVRHWADGGDTKLENLVLLCRFHHRLVHEEGYTVHFPRGERPYFLDPKMRLLPDVAPPPPHLPPEPVGAPEPVEAVKALEAVRPAEALAGVTAVGPAEALVRQNRLRAVEPGALTSAGRYKRDNDVPSAIIMQALHAMEEWGSGNPESSRPLNDPDTSP